MPNFLTNGPGHYWLKHRIQKSFHAYTSVFDGAVSVCGDDLKIADVNEMDIPGNRSKLCNDCFRAIYGFPEALNNKKIIEDFL